MPTTINNYYYYNCSSAVAHRMHSESATEEAEDNKDTLIMELQEEVELLKQQLHEMKQMIKSLTKPKVEPKVEPKIEPDIEPKVEESKKKKKKGVKKTVHFIKDCDVYYEDGVYPKRQEYLEVSEVERQRLDNQFHLSNFFEAT